MSKISDEIRRWCSWFIIHHNDIISNDDYDKMVTIADRIDDEMIELPKGRDGKTIHVGDTVWDAEYDIEYDVDNITFYKVEQCAIAAYSDGNYSIIKPQDVVSTKPDSLERIADELEDLCEEVNSGSLNLQKSYELVDRIRKFAEKDGSDE